MRVECVVRRNVMRRDGDGPDGNLMQTRGR